jgi:uncharacterized protein YcbX
MRVAALFAYPVKACAGLALESAQLEALGVAGDRRYAFVDGNGRALTQREHPQLATIRPTPQREALHLDLGGLARIEVPLAAFTEALQVDVWGRAVSARAASLSAPAQDYLGAPVRLALLDPAARRAFSDAQPVLVAATPMLARLNAVLTEPVGMERFRPNLVVDGDGDWRLLQGDEVRLERTEPCGRCEVTTIDQASGERRGDEPLRTLGERFEGNFGIYFRVARGGRLRLGEALQAG